MEKKIKKSKRLYVFFIILGYIVVAVPAIIYNAVNYKAFQNITTTKWTFSFMVAICMFLIAVFAKTKGDKNRSTSGPWLLAIGAILAITGEIATQIGFSMLFIGGGLLLDALLFHPIAMRFKEGYLEASGEKVVHVKSLKDWF